MWLGLSVLVFFVRVQRSSASGRAKKVYIHIYIYICMYGSVRLIVPWLCTKSRFCYSGQTSTIFGRSLKPLGGPRSLWGPIWACHADLCISGLVCTIVLRSFGGIRFHLVILESDKFLIISLHAQKILCPEAFPSESHGLML